MSRRCFSPKSSSSDSTISPGSSGVPTAPEASSGVWYGRTTAYPTSCAFFLSLWRHRQRPSHSVHPSHRRPILAPSHHRSSDSSPVTHSRPLLPQPMYLWRKGAVECVALFFATVSQLVKIPLHRTKTCLFVRSRPANGHRTLDSSGSSTTTIRLSITRKISFDCSLRASSNGNTGRTRTPTIKLFCTMAINTHPRTTVDACISNITVVIIR